MSDVTKAYEQIEDFLNNETEKTLLLCGIADKEKHLSLLKALNENVIKSRNRKIESLIKKCRDIEFERGLKNKLKSFEMDEIKEILKKYGLNLQDT
jgi:replication initiation and membrane attachment protein DnaB